MTRIGDCAGFARFLASCDAGRCHWSLGGAAEIGTDAETARNRRLAEHSDFVIGFPATATEDGSGTWETLNVARTLNHPRLVVPIRAAPAEYGSS